MTFMMNDYDHDQHHDNNHDDDGNDDDDVATMMGMMMWRMRRLTFWRIMNEYE